MNFAFKRKKGVQRPLPPDVEDAKMSVFRPQEAEVGSSEHAAETFVDVDEPSRDDNQPVGPEIPDHLVAPAEIERREALRMEQSAGVVVDGVLADSGLIAEEVPGDAKPASAEPKKSRFGFKRSPKAEKSKKTGNVAGKQNRPLRVLIGFVPGVTEKDALAYAIGIAEKHVENIENAYYDAFAYLDGYVYEIHEGGTGHAFVPAAIKHFETSLAEAPDSEPRMHIRTGTRTVELTRKPSLVESILLPESAPVPKSPQPEAGPYMRLALNKRTGLLIAGAVVFGTGFLASVLFGLLFRLTPPADISMPKPERIQVFETAAGQWTSKLTVVPEGKYVKALRFDGKKWSVEYDDVEKPEGENKKDAQ